MKIKYSFFICFFYSLSTFSQLLFDYSIEEIKVKNRGQAYQTYSNTIFDNDGVVWYTNHNAFVEDFGNNEVYHELNIDKKNNEKIQIVDFLQKRNGVIYASIEKGGVYIFNPLTGYGELKKEYINGKIIKPFQLSLDSDENVWMITEQDVILKYNAQGEVTRYPIAYDDPKNRLNRCLKVFFIKKDVIIKERSKIYLLDKEKNKFSLIYKPKLNIKGTSVVYENGTIFTKNTSGKYAIDNYNQQYDYLSKLNAQVINVPGDLVISVDKENNYLKNYKIDFISAKGSTLSVYSWLKKGKQLKKITTINFTRNINQIKLNENILLVATAGRLHKVIFKRNKFKNFMQSRERERSTRGITVDKDKNVYVIDNLKVLKIKDNQEEVLFEKKESGPFFWNLIKEKDSLLWFSGVNNKIFSYNINNQKLDTYDIPYKQKKGKLFICQALLDYNRNEMLLGGNFGLLIFNKITHKFKKYNTKFNIQEYFIKDILIHKNTLWIATEYNGVFSFNEKTGEQRHYSSKNITYKLTEDRIYDIHLSNKNDIWIGSVNGVDILNTKTSKIIHYGVENGLPDKRIVSIIETDQDFWLGTFNGLARFDKQTKKVSCYSTNDGLPSNEFNQKSFYKHNDSFLVFGGLNGITIFNPNEIKRKKKKSKVKLIKAFFYNKTLDSMICNQYNLEKIKNIDIPYNKNYISLTFGSINGGKIMYKIPELHTNWFFASDMGEVNLIALPEGKYNLIVRSENPNGEGEKSLRYNINIRRAFYQKPFVNTTLILMIILIVTRYYYLIKNKKKYYAYKIRQLHDKAYRAQMNPHFIFNVINNIQSVLFLKGEEVVNEYISSFSRLLRITLQNSDRERITLKEEIEYLKTYLKLIELKNEIKINVIFNIDEELLIDKIRIPPMLFQPIIENAIIHGLKNKKGEKKIEINFKQTNNILLGVIKDNGIGIEAAKKIATKGKYRSYGNKILNERIKILNEMHALKIVLKVREKRTKGTEVVLMIPLYKKTPRKHQKNK